MSLVVTASALWYPAPVFAQATIIGTSSDPTTAGVEATYPHDDESFLVCDDGDATKCTEFELSGLTTGNNPIWSLAGTTASPSIQGGTGNWFLRHGGTDVYIVASGGFGLGARQLYGGATVSGTDVGFIRAAAGAWRLSDASTGYGQLRTGGLALNNRITSTVDAATTFAVTTASSYVVLACTGAETINTITGGATGMLLYLEHTDTDCTIADDDDATATDAIDLTGAATNDVGAVNKVITLIYNGTYWLQTAESDN